MRRLAALTSTIVAAAFLVLASSSLAAAQTELIANGNFASGSSGWVLSGNFFADSRFSACRSCLGYAYLSNADGTAGNSLFGTIYQIVTIPSSATSASLSFWYNITSQETGTTPFDVLNVTIQNSGGGFLSTVAVLDNTDKGTLGVYTQRSFDMSPFIGQTVRLHFLGSTDSSLPTTFRIDDVSLTVTEPPPPSQAQVTVGPSPLGFGSIQVGTCTSRPFAIQHVFGTGPASGTVSVGPNPPFSLLSGSPFSVSNGSAVNVEVLFCPTSQGSFSGSATVSSLGTIIGGSNPVALTGSGFNPTPTTGAILVRATFNGAPWSGTVNYTLNGPVIIVGNGPVPNDFQDRPAGTYTLNYTSGGPPGAILSSITPSPTQTLSGGGSITFTLNFSQAPPRVTLGPTPLNFGDVQVGTCTQRSFAIQHILGTGPASGTVSASPNPPFSIAAGSPFSASNGSGPLVTVQFCPTSPTSGPPVTFSGSAVVSSPGTTFTNTNTVTLTGRGVAPTPTKGAILVRATFNGAAWAGTVNYTLTGPTTIVGNGPVPNDFQDRDAGTYTFNYTSGGPPGATLASITPSATQTLSGGGSITFTLSFTAPDTVTITSGPSGTPNPVASGGPVNLSVVATDSLNHQLSYTWSALCSGLPSNGSLSNLNAQNPVWTAPTNTTGSAKTCTLTVTASDGFGHSDTKSFTQTVNSAVSDTVTITSGPSGTPNPVASAGTVNLSVVATDSVGHSLGYVWSALCSGLPSNGTFNNTSTQNPTWTAPTNTTGSAKTCTLTVTASDGFGHSDTKSFTQTVNTQPAGVGGVIEIKATFNAGPWSGPIVFRLDGPGGLAGASVPLTSSNSTAGDYTLSYSSGGPPGAIFTGIAPNGTQHLNPGATITFTLQFQSHPILLVHGWKGCAREQTWGRMKELLGEQFGTIDYFDNAPDGSSSGDHCVTTTDTPIETLAIYLAEKVKQIRHRFPRPEEVTVDIVAHSMGGLVARTWIAQKTGPETPLLPPYNGEIGRLITIATPHYGARLAILCKAELAFGALGSVCKGQRQSSDMEYASKFLWDLHHAWENPQNAGKRPTAKDILTIVGTDDAVVGEPANAALSDLNVRARYVNKNHNSVISSSLGINSPTILQGALLPCGLTSGIVCVDANHPTFKLVRSFLQEPSADPPDCGTECASSPPSSVGNLFMRFVEKSDPSIPIPVDFDTFDPAVTLGPPDATPANIFHHHGGGGGTLLVTNVRSGSYPLTIHGSRFNPVTPKYKDSVLPSIGISSGRTMVVPQQALERTADIYTVTLATVKDVYVAGKELFSLFVQLCCTIPTAQSNRVQSFTSSADAQSPIIDGYVWVEIPGGARFFLMPDLINFTDVRTLLVASLPIQNFAGPILSMPIPDFLPVGTYTFFTVGAIPGGDPLNPAHWVTNRAQLSVTLTK